MKNKLQLFIFTSILFILFPKITLAENTIFINEFTIDPQPQMVEILNNGVGTVDISGWYIDDNGGTTFYTIPQNSIINANSCLTFSADFNLNKASADAIRLFNNFAAPTSIDAVIIDSYSYKNSPGINISYLRLPDGSTTWATASANIGKLNQSNISCIMISPTPTVTPTPTPTTIIYSTPTATPTLVINPTPTITTTPTIIPTINITPTIYNNIYISEIMVYPEAGQNEWVELYNDNDFSVDLINWYIDDIENGGSSPKLFSLNILPKSYGVFDLTTNMFNNDDDSVRLLDFNKNMIDSIEYIDPQQTMTLGRTSIDSDELCIQQPSKGSTNNSCVNPTPTPTNKISTSTNTTPTKIPTKKQPTPIKIIKQNNSINQSIESKKVFQTSSNNLGQNISNIENGNVLGTYSNNNINNNFQLSLLKSLSFASICYSLLTLAAISFKIINSEKII